MAIIASSNPCAEPDAQSGVSDTAMSEVECEPRDAAGERVAPPRMIFDREMQAARRHWSTRMQSVSFDPFLPLDRPRPVDGARSFETLDLVLDAGLHARLRRLTSGNPMLLFAVLTLGIRLYGGNITGRDMVTLFVPTTREVAEDLLPVAELLDDGMSVRDALLASRELLASAYRYQRYGLNHLRFDLGQVEAARRPPLVVAMAGLHRDHVAIDADINLLFIPADGACDATIRFDTRVYDADTISGFFDTLQHLLDQALAGMEQPLRSLSTAVPVPSLPVLEEIERIQDVIDAIARTVPERIAVVERDVATRYGELTTYVDRLAETLSAMQLDPSRPIAVLAEGGLETIVATLASWKSGHAIVPLDPGALDLPLADTVAALGCACLICGHALGEREDVLGSAQVSLCVVLAPSLTAAAEVRVPLPTAHPLQVDTAQACTADVAVVLPPDGQGRIGHADLARVIGWINAMREIGVDDSSLVWSTMPLFDRAYATLGLLMAGGSVVFAEPWLPDNPNALAGQFAHCGASIWVLRWPLLDEVLRAIPADARGPAHIVVTGATPQGALASRALNRFPKATLDGFWQADAGVPWSVHFAFSGEQTSGEEVGTPIAGIEHRVVHAAGGAAPLATAGALQTRRIGETAWHETGLRARALPGGRLVWLRDHDHAVWRRDCRIALSRIEAELGGIAGVRLVEVVAEAGPDDGARLLAFVSVDEGTAETLLDQAVRRGTFDPGVDRLVVVEHWPLGPMGDLDRIALLARHGHAPETVETVHSTEAIRARLRPLWLQTLQLDAVDDEESFFGSGGNSLKATLLITRIKETFGIPVSVQEFFRKPTISAISELIAARHGAGPESDGSQLRPVSREKGRMLRSEVERQIQTA